MLLALRDFAGDLSADQVEAAIARLGQAIRQRYPEIRRVFIEAQSWRAHRHALEREHAAGEAGVSATGRGRSQRR